MLRRTSDASQEEWECMDSAACGTASSLAGNVAELSEAGLCSQHPKHMAFCGMELGNGTAFSDRSRNS